MPGRGDNNKSGSSGRGASNQSNQGFHGASDQRKSNRGESKGTASRPQKKTQDSSSQRNRSTNKEN